MGIFTIDLEQHICPKCRQHTPMAHIPAQYKDSDGYIEIVRYFRCMGCLGLFKLSNTLEEVSGISNVQIINDKKYTWAPY